MSRAWSLFALLALGQAAFAAEPALPAPDYLQTVRGAVDSLLEHGRDTYGEQKTAMIISILDRKTLAPPEKLPKPAAGVRESDRTNRFGSNAGIQQNLYRTMMLLSDVTGQARYREAAEAALVDFVRRTQSPETHLLGWGEHIFYDCETDQVAANPVDSKPQSLIHEMKKPLVFWDFLYEHEPQRMIDFARGLWDHQIYDHKTGDFSRHTNWDKHNPRKGYDFTKEGGYMIDVWSRAYAAKQEETMRQAVTVLASRYRGKLNQRELLDYDGSRPNYCNNGHNITLATECTSAAARYGGGDDPTAKLLWELAGRIDKGFLACNHAPGDPQRGFIATCLTENGEPCDREGPGPGGYSVLWGLGYGKQTTAMVALNCYHRFRQLPAGPTRDNYRKLFLEAAKVYRTTSLPTRDAKLDVWGVEPGLAILLEVAAFRETGEREYLEAAQRLAAEAVAGFWSKDCPLPKASLLTTHYEAMTGTDTLLLALLAVHCETHGQANLVPISELDR